MNKHLIKIDDNNIVIHAESDAFLQNFIGSIDDYIFIKEGGRHYRLDLREFDGCPIYKYDNGIIELSEAERTTWRAENIEPIVDYDAELSTNIDIALDTTNIQIIEDVVIVLNNLKIALIGGGKAKIKGRKK